MFVIRVLLITILLSYTPGFFNSAHAERQGVIAPLANAVRPPPQWRREGHDYVRNSRWKNRDGYIVRGQVVYSHDGTTYVRRAPQYHYPRIPGNVAMQRNFGSID